MEAAAWWMRLQKDESVGFSIEFQEWIANPANDRKFRAITRATEALDAFETSPSIVAMDRSAYAWFENRDASRQPVWKVTYAMAAAALLISIGIGTYYLLLARPTSYQTAIGERQTFALEDGSHVLLDSNSEVDVHYSKSTRAVTLTKGRARFDVAHDTARPFTVAAGAETVIAVGTAFDVELRDSKVLVTLIQGRVLIRGAPDDAEYRGESDAPIRLNAGQQLVATTDHKPTIAPVDLSVAQAWEAGHLVFRKERLADAAEQINRYVDHPIIVDPSAASFRISGVFNAGDTKSFVGAATELYPVEAVSDADGTITLRRDP